MIIDRHVVEFILEEGNNILRDVTLRVSANYLELGIISKASLDKLKTICKCELMGKMCEPEMEEACRLMQESWGMTFLEITNVVQAKHRGYKVLLSEESWKPLCEKLNVPYRKMLIS